MNFTGPKVKKSRALGVALTPKADKYMKKRPYGPGQHGQRRRRRPSDYGVQLLEKQRLRFQYNVSERQLQRAYEQATRKSGPTGEILIQLLETRLDAMVLRAGLAPSIFAARQFVTHGHLMLNGKKVNIPSQRVKPGDVITVREKSKNLVMFQEGRVPANVPGYLSFDESTLTAKLISLPPRDEVPVIVNEQLVVEYYSR
ncbi:MAG: 30S ribosomal protein S4 [Thermomicrobiales bacterium]